MSNRDSLGFGEMVPQDVVDIFAQEKHGKASRKKRSRSLGRAFGWLKGKKKKDHRGDRQNAGLSPALDLAHSAGHKGGHKSGKHANAHGNSHVPRLDGDDKTLAPPLFQENVFIESSRPKYLEDLHTEALEGRKMMQEEETSTGMEYRDNMSTTSTLSVQTDGEGGGFTTDCTIPDSSSVVSVKSSASTRSSRSGLTRQGSTFRPLNSGKKSKTRKRHRKTVAGIPQHVQRELGLDRGGWVMPSKLDEEQQYNGESDYSTTSDSTLGPDSPDAGATSPETPNNVHPLSRDKVALLNAAHGNSMALFHHLDQDFGSEARPSPSAVPWLTSASSLQQELPSPVMSMSPQAAYMSKIIPNAVLPPSIDVVEISRGRSRHSVRTVSKSSLVLSSPAPSRASSRASSTKTTSSNASTITSASRQNLPHLSDSNWSNSDSSETLVSNSSTISNSSTPSQRRSHNGDAQGDDVGFRSNGKINVTGEDAKKDGQFGRSLSVMKAKRAPPPPSRSYSLHSKMKRRSRDLAEVRVLPGEPPTQSISPRGEEKTEDKPGGLDSPGYHGDTSSLEDSPSSGSPGPNKVLNKSAEKGAGTENKLNMVSPSSGYSSQDASSPQTSKLPLGSSPKHKRGILAKLQRLFPGSSSAPPPSSSAETSINTKTDTVSPSVQALRELFNIPQHPKVHAPPPPPPEVWAHSRRSFELLLGPPAPDNVYAIIKKNPKDRRQQRASPLSGKKVQESGVLITEIHEEKKERLTLNVESKESQNEKVSGSDILNGMLAKAVEKRKERLAARREEEVSKASGQNADTSPDISLVRAPGPSPAPPARHGPVPPPPATMSHESSWPPPPPPLVVSPLDELDFTLPPPPLFAEGASVLPVQVPPNATSQGVVVVTAPPPLSIPPPPSYTAPPPPASVSPLLINKFPHPPKTNGLPVIQEVVSPPPAPPPPGIFSLPPTVQNTSTAAVTVVSRPEVVDVSALPPDDIPPPPPQEGVRRLTPSESIPPPPPPLPPQPPPPPEQLKVNVQHKSVERSESGLGPPDNIPPPPPGERLRHTSVLVAPPPPPAPPPLNAAALPPVQSLLVQHQLVENLTPEKTPVAPEESSPIVTPSLLQMVKLRSVSSSPEPPKAEEQPKVEVTLRKKLPGDIVLMSSPGGEAPQKPVRRSLIVTSPTSPSPPTTATPPPTSPPVTVASASPSTVESSVEVLPPAPVVAAPASSPVPSGDKAPAAPPAAPPAVAPPVSSTTVTTVEISPPAAPTTTVVVQSTSVPATDSSVETPPPATPAAPPASPPTVKPMEDSPPVPADAAVVPPPSSIEDPPPAMTFAPLTSAPTPPPASIAAPVAPPPSSTVPPPVEASPPASIAGSVAPPSSSTEDSPPAPSASPPPPASIAAPVAAPPPPSSSTVEKSPPVTTVPPVVVTPPSSATAVSPVKKSPSATTAPPSMNLQEAIRLRTAARSKEAPASRLSLTSPTSPKDFRTSPTSTASFIFSKSNRKVVIETRPKAEVRGDAQRSPQLSPVAKVTPKVPPPVAKKPKSKSNNVEASEGTESSAETIRDVEEKANGTAGGVEEGTTAT